MKVPFVVYADFEAFTEEISTCEPNQKFSFTQKYQRHQPSGFCYKIVCFDERYNQKPVSSGQRVKMKISVQFLLKCLSRISREFKKNSNSQKR